MKTTNTLKTNVTGLYKVVNVVEWELVWCQVEEMLPPECSQTGTGLGLGHKSDHSEYLKLKFRIK